jgi:hypothetical protein
MNRIFLVGEDQLCLALGQRLVEFVLPRWLVTGEVDKKGITNLVPRLPDYALQAEHVQPVLCIADTDGACAAELMRGWLPRPTVPQFLLRLAVQEAESWALADSEAFANALAVPRSKVPRDPEALKDAKGAVLRLARRSKIRRVREEVVSMTDPGRPGSGYNLHLCGFVKAHWRAGIAAKQAPGLRRAVERFETLAASS